MPKEVQVCGPAPLHMGDEPQQFLHRDGDQNRGCDQAAADRLLLFALPEAAGVFVSSKRAQAGEEREGEHRKRYVTMPTGPTTRFTMIKSGLPLADWKHSSIVQRNPGTAARSRSSLVRGPNMT